MKRLPTLKDIKVPAGGLLNAGLRKAPSISHLTASKVNKKLERRNFKNIGL